MKGLGDVVVVKESKCFFIRYKVNIESRIMRKLWGVLGLEVWDRS